MACQVAAQRARLGQTDRAEGQRHTGVTEGQMTYQGTPSTVPPVYSNSPGQYPNLPSQSTRSTICQRPLGRHSLLKETPSLTLFRLLSRAHSLSLSTPRRVYHTQSLAIEVAVRGRGEESLAP